MAKDIKARVQGQDPNIMPRSMNDFIQREGDQCFQHETTSSAHHINIIFNAFEKVSQRCFCWWYTIIMTFIYVYN